MCYNNNKRAVHLEQFDRSKKFYVTKFFIVNVVFQAATSQGKTLECLSSQTDKLETSCKHEILRVAELQSDDYHMDRTLFYACREAREHFCEKTPSGGGKVFKCLYKHKFDKAMDPEASLYTLLFCKHVLYQKNVRSGIIFLSW